MSELRAILFDVFMQPFEKLALHKRRKEIIPEAKGKVLEIGAGTGRNFDYYSVEKVEQLTLMDLEFNKGIKAHPLNDKIKIDYIEGSAENLPFQDQTFHSVVATLVFCSINEVEKALNEVYRVLKPGGKIFFIEHVLPQGKRCSHMVNSFNDTWKKIGKCNINRETLKLIQAANFKVIRIERVEKGCFVFIKGIGVKE